LRDQPADEYARQNKELERDAAAKADSNKSHPALAARQARLSGFSRIDFADPAL